MKTRDSDFLGKKDPGKSKQKIERSDFKDWEAGLASWKNVDLEAGLAR